MNMSAARAAHTALLLLRAIQKVQHSVTAAITAFVDVE
jgi:hypothetical protein